jgi:protein-disulfide isomerase
MDIARLMRSDMKRLLVAAALATLSLSAFAAGPADLETVRAYTLRTLQKCPDSKLDMKPVNNGGPAGFLMYEATLTSSDTSCGRHVYVLVSPVTQQTVVGTVFQLDRNGAGNVETRVSALASELLQSRIHAVIAGFPLPDGLRSVSMNKETPQGTFAYHGFVDSTGSFLIVGTRGNLKVDPGKSLLDALNVATEGVHRGNKVAKAEIIELSDFQCPTCGRAHKKVEPIIEKNLSKVNYTRLDLPLFEHHEWSLDAAMGARAIRKVAPKSYWDYVNFVFGNQETIGKTEFATVLKDFCSDHDIDYKKVEPLYKSPKERAALLDQVSRAFDNGINSTPTYIVNGQIMGFGPEGTFTIDAIKKALGVK